MYMGGGSVHESAGVCGNQGNGPPGAGGIEGCELPSMDAGN